MESQVKEVGSLNRIQELDALRGIAAIAVLLFHFTYGFNHNDTNYIFHYGNLGVQLFFIISGFVITLSLEKSKNVFDFIAARVSRLYPAYWFAVLFLSLLALLYRTRVIDPIDIAANLTMFQYWFRIPDIAGVFWTLTIELSFYILIVLVLLFKQFKRIELLSWLFLILMLINVLIGEQLTYWIPVIRYGNFFVAGIIFYNIRKHGGNYFRYYLLLCCIVIQFALATLIEGVAAILFFVIFFLLINNKLPWLKNRILLFLGTISYSIYLIHENLGSVLFQRLEGIGIEALISKMIISFAVVTFLATFITYVIEKPITNALKNYYKSLKLFFKEKKTIRF
jgi:peptidoglycan/LPS O-acetylase OafA/YrhL